MSADVAKYVNANVARHTNIWGCEWLLLSWINEKWLVINSFSETITSKKARLLHASLIKKKPCNKWCRYGKYLRWEQEKKQWYSKCHEVWGMLNGTEKMWVGFCIKCLFKLRTFLGVWNSLIQSILFLMGNFYSMYE